MKFLHFTVMNSDQQVRIDPGEIVALVELGKDNKQCYVYTRGCNEPFAINSGIEVVVALVEKATEVQYAQAVPLFDYEEERRQMRDDDRQEQLLRHDLLKTVLS